MQESIEQLGTGPAAADLAIMREIAEEVGRDGEAGVVSPFDAMVSRLAPMGEGGEAGKQAGGGGKGWGGKKGQKGKGQQKKAQAGQAAGSKGTVVVQSYKREESGHTVYVGRNSKQVRATPLGHHSPHFPVVMVMVQLVGRLCFACGCPLINDLWSCRTTT
jgi:hypothetical protein